MTTQTLLEAAQKLQEVLHEICVEDYIEEIVQEHLQKYGENYRSDRLARYRDEKLTYCNAMSEFIEAIEREKAKPDTQWCKRCQRDTHKNGHAPFCPATGG